MLLDFLLRHREVEDEQRDGDREDAVAEGLGAAGVPTAGHRAPRAVQAVPGGAARRPAAGRCGYAGTVPAPADKLARRARARRRRGARRGLDDGGARGRRGRRRLRCAPGRALPRHLCGLDRRGLAGRRDRPGQPARARRRRNAGARPERSGPSPQAEAEGGAGLDRGPARGGACSSAALPPRRWPRSPSARRAAAERRCAARCCAACRTAPARSPIWGGSSRSPPRLRRRLLVAAVELESGRRVIFGAPARPVRDRRAGRDGLLRDSRLLRPDRDRRAPLRRRRRMEPDQHGRRCRSSAASACCA